MPLIKANQSVPLFKDAIVLNMNDVTEQAAQIKESARRSAQQLIDEAKSKAQKVSDDHASEGYERGYADGYQKGQAEGYAKGKKRGMVEGHKEASDEAREAFKPLVAAWQDAGTVWDEYHSKLDMDARDSVIELALRLAEKIIHRQLQVDNQVIVDQVTAALKSQTGATNLSININPDDRPVMTQFMPKLLDVFSQFKHMRIVDDENIGRGGCILIHEHGRLDASLETQLRRAVELLLPGDLEVEPDAVIKAEAPLQIVADEIAQQTEAAEASVKVAQAVPSQDAPEKQSPIQAPVDEQVDLLSDALDQADQALSPSSLDEFKSDTSTES